MDQILACIDASEYATSVVDNAALAARRLGIGVEVLHVIQRTDAVARRRDWSGAVGLGAKTDLLTELADIDAAEAKLARQRGDLLLQTAKDRLHEQGITDVTLTHRHGGIVETIVEREADARLVVIGKRGGSADFAKGHLGSNVERVVRASDRPVFVASRTYRDVNRIVIAYDGGKTADAAVALAATSPLAKGCAIHLVMAGKDSDKTRGRLAAAVASMPGHEVTSAFIKGDVEDAIVEGVASFDADMLLMGAYSHAPLRSLLVGSTTTHMLRDCKVPVLLFR